MSIQNTGAEQDYNSSVDNFDTKRVPQWNHELQLGELQATMIGNVAYYTFLIDINEPNGGAKSTVSLDAFKIWISPTFQSSTSTDALGHFNGSLGNLVFDLGNNSVTYNDQNSGSGSCDIKILVPVSLLANANPTDYIYVYERFSGAQGGFEETSAQTGALCQRFPRDGQ